MQVHESSKVDVMVRQPSRKATGGAFIREIAVLKPLPEHPGVIKWVLACVLSELFSLACRYLGHTTSALTQMVLFEFCSNGNLRDYARKVLSFDSA